MDSRGKYLAKNTIIFAIGNIATKLISFVLVPLYTSILSTSQNGVVDLVNTMGNVLAPVLILNISEAVMRFSLDKEADYKKIMSVGMMALLLAAFLGLAIIPGSKLIIEIAPYAKYVYFYTLSLSASQLFLCYLRGKEKLGLYSVGNIIQTVFIAFLNIVFLRFMGLGVCGYFTAYIIANFISAIYAFVAGNVIRVIKEFQIDKNLTRSMLKYSIVLIPNTFMWWIMNSSDRVMVTSMIGVAANGVYAVSYKLPSLVSTLTTIFNQAWSYSAIREDGAEDEKSYNNKVFIQLISTVMLLSIALLTVVKPFLKIYIDADYYDAWRYTPFLIVGSAYLTMATFMATSYTVHKDSFGYLFSATFGAALNIVLNYLLIPIIGVYGAAFATCVSYIAVFIFRLIHTREYIEYDVKNKEFIGGSILLIMSSILLFWDNIIGVTIQIILLAIAFFMYFNVWIPVVRMVVKKIFRR